MAVSENRTVVFLMGAMTSQIGIVLDQHGADAATDAQRDQQVRVRMSGQLFQELKDGHTLGHKRVLADLADVAATGRSCSLPTRAQRPS